MKKCPLLPVQDRLVVRVDEWDRQTRGGIHLPEVSEKKPQRGTVVAVGPGDYDHGVFVPVLHQPGQVVWWAWGAGWEVEAGGQTYLVLQRGDVLCVEEGSAHE